MRLRPRITFSGEWAGLVREVSRQCNMDVDTFCTRAIMLTIKQGIDKTNVTEHNAALTESERDNEPSPAVQDPDSDTLSNS